MAEIKAGYKQTDIGVIPEDWDIKSYGEAFEFLSTISNSRADLCFKGDFGYIHYGDIHTRWANTLDLSKDELPEIRRDKIKKLPASLRNGDLVMADASEDYEGIAKTVEVKNIGEKKVFSGLHTFLMRDRNAVFADGIRGYIHEMPLVRQQIQKIATGLKVFGVSKNTLKNVQIPVPKPEEQKAIAGALSDVDGLIESLEQLIAKKCDMKTAAIQQLLTGKKRLPGFDSSKGYRQTNIGVIPEDWDVMSVFDFGSFKSGNGFPLSYQGHKNGDLPFFKVSDMNNVGNATYMKNANNYVSDEVSKKLKLNIVPEKSIVFAKIGAAIFLERKKLTVFCSCIDNNMMAFLINKEIGNIEYFRYLFLNTEFGKLVSATALPSLSSKDIGELRYGFPKKKEQTAIATVLSDMDSEIDALEQRLEKARSLKTGMMQALLTGRTRLITTDKKQETV